MSHPLRDLTGQPFGELTVIKRIGSKEYMTRNKTIHKLAVWLMGCRHGHTEERTGASIKISGQNAKCKTCWAGKHF